MNRKIKKVISLLLTLITLFTTSCSKIKDKEEYDSVVLSGCSIIYPYDKNICFIKEDGKILENYITILDSTDSSNPDIKIIDSYLINDINMMIDIINRIIDYDTKYASDNEWDRSKISMLLEWIIHNILYDINILRDRTKDVDFSQNELVLSNKKI